MTELEELKKLLAEATERPWEAAVDHEYVMSPIVIHHYDVDADADGDPRDYGKDICEMCDTGQEDANAALIVAAVNALPKLIARVEEMEAELEAARVHAWLDDELQEKAPSDERN